jgi:hypothetical protein
MARALPPDGFMFFRATSVTHETPTVELLECVTLNTIEPELDIHVASEEKTAGTPGGMREVTAIEYESSVVTPLKPDKVTKSCFSRR